MEQYIFYFLGALALMSAGYMVFAKNPLYAILSLIVTFFSIAGLYVLLNAQFLGIVQIIVYSGAIMVLFLYVLMMLNLSAKDESKKHNLLRLAGVVASGIIMIGLLGAFKGYKSQIPDMMMGPANPNVGLTKTLGKLLFSEYVLPFELASILILAGIVGAVLIGKKEL